MYTLQIFILVYFSCLGCAVAELINQLRYFETLHHLDVTVRKKRSLTGQDTLLKDISFSALGKNFNVLVKPGSPVLSANYQAKLVYGDGHSESIPVNQNDFYTGHLSGDEGVTADVFLEDGLWTVSVYGPDDVYTLEPSWRHLPPSNNHSMIIYRYSDIKWNHNFPGGADAENRRKRPCGAKHPTGNPVLGPSQNKLPKLNDVPGAERRGGRAQRSASAQNTCHIIAVADYAFFMGPGGGFPHKAASYIIQTMQKVDRIYRETMWDRDPQLFHLGLQIQELRIHPEVTQPGSYHKNGKHYNMFDDQVPWTDEDLLRQFDEDPDLNKFCLAHLFTHRRFGGGVLGLAYIASPRKYTTGGICSFQGDGAKAFNTGFTSSKNTKGHNLLLQEATLVTAHEIGHNWGAEHDAETTECSPDSSQKGQFIMYQYSVSGYDENNAKFSPCSQRYIADVLKAKSESCFKAMTVNTPQCGNGVIDKGEDCDGGGRGLNGQDPCCSKECRLTVNSSCSAANFECCADCRVAPEKTLCREASSELCQNAAYCTGLSLACPQSQAMEDHTPCIDEGKCIKGACRDFCAYEGDRINQELKPCRCEDFSSSCLRCCRSTTGPCQPQNTSVSQQYLQDGRPCHFGYCEAGRCLQGSANVIQRLFAFIEHLDSSSFLAFMKTNIVGTIIVFSLIVWIPFSWTVSCIDKRNEKRYKAQEWMSNEALLFQSLQQARSMQVGYRQKCQNQIRLGHPPFGHSHTRLLLKNQGNNQTKTCERSVEMETVI